MDRNDQQAIEGIFGKLAEVERQSSAPRDAEAEAFIRDRIARQPGAPYYMAQTIVVQQQALQAAQARIEELEGQAADGGRRQGGLIGSAFGGGRAPERAGSVPRVGRPGWGAQPQQPMPGAMPAGRGGGGFLAGAAQTAMGVAGGLLLGNAIMGMLGGGGEAQAAEAAASEPEADEAGFDDGGDFGDTDF